MLSEDTMERLGWTSEKWASVLECSPGTVRESATWKKHIPTTRAMIATERRSSTVGTVG